MIFYCLYNHQRFKRQLGQPFRDCLIVCWAILLTDGNAMHLFGQIQLPILSGFGSDYVLHKKYIYINVLIKWVGPVSMWGNLPYKKGVSGQDFCPRPHFEPSSPLHLQRSPSSLPCQRSNNSFLNPILESFLIIDA